MLRQSLPKRTLTFISRGISGNTVTHLETQWQTDVLVLKPDGLNILIGISDTLTAGGETFK